MKKAFILKVLLFLRIYAREMIPNWERALDIKVVNTA